MSLVVRAAMRMLWLLGWMASTSIAHAQPAGSDAPGQVPEVAPPAAAAAGSTAPAPGAPPGLTAPCPLQSGQPCVAPGTMPAGASRVMQPTLVIQDEPEIDYRWQVFLADSASLAIAFSGNKTGITLSGAGYVLAAPIIHLSHDEGGRAGASLLLRLGLPIAGAFGGAALTRHACAPDDEDCDDGALEGAILGFGLGILTAMVVDTAFIARPIKSHRTTTTWVPQVAITGQHVGLGVAGRF